MLAATQQITLATGILNIWMHDAADVATTHHGLVERFPGRFLLGLGISHSLLVDAQGEQRYAHPVAVMADYLDQLDAAAPPVPTDERIIAALGPKMLALAAARSAGSHPYLVNPEHTAYARGILGPGPLLAPEQKVVIDTDKDRARELARANAGLYLRLPNYVNNLLRMGFTEDDVAGWAVTASSTRSWCRATFQRWRTGCASTSTPGPITCACRCSRPTARRSRSSNGASSPPHCPASGADAPVGDPPLAWAGA